MRQQFDVALRHSLAKQARNRLAWVLLIAFVPGWYLIIGSMMRHAGGAVPAPVHWNRAGRRRP